MGRSLGCPVTPGPYGCLTFRFAMTGIVAELPEVTRSFFENDMSVSTFHQRVRFQLPSPKFQSRQTATIPAWKRHSRRFVPLFQEARFRQPATRCGPFYRKCWSISRSTPLLNEPSPSPLWPKGGFKALPPKAISSSHHNRGLKPTATKTLSRCDNVYLDDC